MSKLTRKQLNVYNRTTGELIAVLTGAKPSKLLERAAAEHANDCWEWDGWNRPSVNA